MQQPFVTMNITLPKELEGFVADQVARGLSASPSEFVQRLIERERVRRAPEAFEQELIEILDQKDFVEVTPEFWRGVRRDLHARLGRRPS